MSWQMEITIGVIIALLFAIVGFLYAAATALNRVEAKANVLEELARLLKKQNSELTEITSMVRKEHRYVPPTVRFCDLCRREYPISTRWWTAYQSGLAPLKLCAYPQQKEKPEDKWLHGEDCIVAELRTYMTNMRRLLEPIEYKQTREYTLYSDSGTETTRVLEVSACDHCRKEYSAPSFWWTVSWRGMEIEISEGFRFNNYHARRCYFCSEECVVAAVRVYIGTQLRELPEQAWETYELASFKSSTPRKEAPER
jgi:hypothetical protein